MITNDTQASVFNAHGQLVEPGAPLFPHGEPVAEVNEGDRPAETPEASQADVIASIATLEDQAALEAFVADKRKAVAKAATERLAALKPTP